MLRAVTRNLVLLVVFLVVGRKRVDSPFAPVRVEPAVLERPSGGVDSFLYGKARNYLHVSEAYRLEEFLSTPSRLQLAHLSVVRKVMRAVPVSFVLQHSYVVFERFPGSFVVVHDPRFLPDHLDEPYGGRVVHSQVPERMRIDRRFDRNLAKAVFRACQTDLVGVVRALYRGLERNVVFLLYEVFVHSIPAFFVDHGICHDSRAVFVGRVFDLEFGKVPRFRILPRDFPKRPAVVLSARRINEPCESSVEFENRTQQVPSSRVADGIFGEEASYRVRSDDVIDFAVGSDELDDGTVDEFQFHRLVVAVLDEFFRNVRKH